MLNIDTSLLQTKNILYVEDDKDTADEVGFFLQNYVSDLFIATNGQEGLKLFSEHKIDLVITDIQMPVMNGLEMIREIKQLNKQIPIMITTAFNETNYLIEALNLGINKYILKPINLKETIRSMSQLFEELETIDFGYYLDTHGKIIDMSLQLLEYMGYLEDDILGQSAFDFVKKYDVERLQQEFSILKSGIALENVHFSIRKKDGTYFEVLLDAEPIFDTTGDVVKIYCEVSSLETYMKSKKKLEKAFAKEHSLRELITIESKIAQSIAHTNDVESFLKNTMGVIDKYGNYAFAFISIKEDRGFRLVSQIEHEKLDIKEILGEVFTFENRESSLCDKCHDILKNQITIINDVEDVPYFRDKEQFLSANIHSVLSLPIYSINNEKIVGILSLFFNKIHNLLKDEVNMYKNIAETIALGVESIEMRLEKEYLIQELEYQANTDQLTKVINRRKGFELLSQEIQRSSRYNNPLSLIYLDIDNFKSINDTYGHKEGDKVLIDMCNHLEDILRLTDSFIRWGGEEFIIILPETDIEKAVLIAEKLRKELETKTNFTASFGVSQYNEKDDVDSFLMKADKNMYKAKELGKNRVMYV